MSLFIFYLNALKDNYIWCITDKQDLWIVDPGESTPVLNFLKNNHLNFKGIFITHHHFDHTGGILELKNAYPQLSIFAPKGIEGTTCFLKGGEVLNCSTFQVQVIAAPGHTLDHLIYKIGERLFVGDVLFGAGCGRLFEGNASQMFDSLNKIQNFSNQTLIYPAHEYTLQNLRFAQNIEPSNFVIQQRIQELEKNPVSVPLSLKIEKQSNPFLRTEQESVRQKLNLTNATNQAVFAALRTMRDSF